MDEIIDKVRDWLGPSGIKFFRDLKERYGKINCVIPGPVVPHPVHFREGMRVRNYLQEITNSAWTAHEYDDRWVEIVEACIQRENHNDNSGN